MVNYCVAPGFREDGCKKKKKKQDESIVVSNVSVDVDDACQ